MDPSETRDVNEIVKHSEFANNFVNIWCLKGLHRNSPDTPPDPSANKSYPVQKFVNTWSLVSLGGPLQLPRDTPRQPKC